VPLVAGLWSAADSIPPLRARSRSRRPKSQTIADTLALYGANTIEVIQQGQPIAAGRTNDSSPFSGGDSLMSSVGTFADGSTGREGCTSGFGGVNCAGNRYMITAAHCINPANHNEYIINGTTLGSANTIDPAHDIAYVSVSGTQPRVWDDGAGSKTVTASAKPAPGDAICQSGVTSGTLCYGTVGNYLHYNLNDGWAGSQTHDVTGWYADRTTGERMVAQGDSGGPVYHPTGTGGVIAEGITSALGSSQQYTCGSLQCSTRILFIDVQTEAVVNHGLNLTR